ncbi:HD domain-containing protein [Labilibacter sediminis]|nr:HD domain-containing protein [Labilibacter sediminis]
MIEQKERDFENIIRFIIEIDKVKQIVRQTLLMDQSRHENDAEHSWHMALALFLLKDYASYEELDLVKAVKMVLIHDIVEIDAGDTYAYDIQANHDKYERELKAAKRIFGLLPEDLQNEFMSLWQEFEEGNSPEAQFVGAVDRFMPILHNYKTQGMQWKKHQVTTKMVEERNKPIQQGSEFLWQKVLDIIEDSKQKGFLK